jgi:predicted component of type VI protein secretion system
MPIKLQVIKEGDDGEPADYLFEQDRITIGRGSNNDLTLPDQKVSSEHAEIRNDGGTYLLVDRDSKNKTFVDGRRVGEGEPYPLNSGDVFRVGDFKVEFAPLFMPSSETTAYAEENENANPFERHTRQLAAALEGLAETYKFTRPEERDASFAAALEEHLDADVAAEEGVQRVLAALGATEEAAPTAQPSAASADAAATSTVLDSLLESVTRMISIPNYFWREFTGTDLDHPPEKQVLYDADVEDLREHLLAEDVTAAERDERLRHLSDAVESLVTHNMAMLAGYRKSVMAGSKELLHRVSPLKAVEEAEEEGGMMEAFFGGDEASELERLEQRWRTLVRREWGEVEEELFRPTYVDAYVDRMAETWDLDRAEILNEDPA